ncbi:MAG: disulfide bond formation protein B [Pseudomonadota bacterium]
MSVMTRRLGWLSILLIGAGMMGYALYSQYVLELYPCPLCMFQRVALIALMLVALLALLHNPGRTGQRIYGLLGLLTGAGGVAIASRHVWLQNLPADQVPSCGAGLEFMMETLPLLTVVREVLTASGECANISWQFLGLSMPAWVAIMMSVLTAVVLLTAFRWPAAYSTGSSIVDA